MPLNVDDNEKPDKPKPQPILHAPNEGMSGTAKMVIWLLGLLVVASVIFITHQYRLVDWGNLFPKSQTGTEAGKEPVTSTDELPQQKNAEQQPATSAPGVKDEPRAMTAGQTETGRFTVIVNSYKSKMDAEQEAGRWIAAGYSAFVQDVGGWHRVAVGRYDGLGKAREFAENFKDAFENGYWIVTVQ